MRRRRFLATIGAAATVGGCAGLPWSADSPAYTYDAAEPITSIATTPTTVFLGGSSQSDPGQVTALEPGDGSVRWQRGIAIPGYGMHLAVAGDTILVWDAIDLELSGFDGFGDQPWTVEDIESFPPPAKNDIVYLHRGTTIDALALTDATRLWRAPPTHPAGDQGTPVPETVIGNHVIAATWDGYLTGIDLADGSPEWWTQTTNIGPLFAHRNQTVFVGGHFLQGPVELSRLDATTGAHTRLTEFENRRVAPVQATERLLVQTSGANGYNVHRIDPATGHTHWTVTDLETTTASTDAEHVAGYDRTTERVEVYDTATGTLEWRVDLDDTDTDIDVLLTQDAVLVRDATTLTAYDRPTGDRRTNIAFDRDAVGRRLLHADHARAYLVVASTLYAMAL